MPDDISEEIAERIIAKGGQLLNVPPADSRLTFSSRESLRQIIIEVVKEVLKERGNG